MKIKWYKVTSRFTNKTWKNNFHGYYGIVSIIYCILLVCEIVLFISIKFVNLFIRIIQSLVRENQRTNYQENYSQQAYYQQPARSGLTLEEIRRVNEAAGYGQAMGQARGNHNSIAEKQRWEANDAFNRELKDHGNRIMGYNPKVAKDNIKRLKW